MEADRGLNEGGFIIFVTTTPNIYKLALCKTKVTVKVKFVATHDRFVVPVKSVQTESLENYKMLGNVIIKILDPFNKAF